MCVCVYVWGSCTATHTHTQIDAAFLLASRHSCICPSSGPASWHRCSRQQEPLPCWPTQDKTCWCCSHNQSRQKRRNSRNKKIKAGHHRLPAPHESRSAPPTWRPASAGTPDVARQATAASVRLQPPPSGYSRPCQASAAPHLAPTRLLLPSYLLPRGLAAAIIVASLSSSLQILSDTEQQDNTPHPTDTHTHTLTHLLLSVP